MNKQSLKEIPRSSKIDFLNKLSSGKFELKDSFKPRLLPAIEPQPKLNFDIQSDGLYICREDRRLMTSKEIKSLPGYMMMIELVNDRSQVNHECPAAGFVLIPFGKTDYLQGLLVSNEGNPDHSPEDFSEILKDLSISELKQLHASIASIAENGKKNNIDQEMNKRINSMKGSIDIEEWIKIEGHSTDVDSFIEKNLLQK